MPTYKLNLTTLEAIKKKVWLPDKQAAEDHKTEMINVIELLGGFLQKASRHHNIHIGFTGGYDSAVILAVLREFNIPFTPFLFVGDLNSKIDLFNASKIGKKYGFEIKALQETKGLPSSPTRNNLMGGSLLRHISSIQEFNEDDIWIFGICGECGIYDYTTNNNKLDLLNVPGIVRTESTEENSFNWMKNLRNLKVNNNTDISNNFLIDCRLGGWGGAHYSFDNIACQMADPFNQPDVVQTMINFGSLNLGDRFFHKTLLNMLDPKLLNMVIKNKPKNSVVRRINRLRAEWAYFFQ